MIHLGSITEIDGSAIEPVDCITGGSPCQDLSVAGQRKGLAGERSGLFMEQIRVVKEMRNATINNIGLARPRYMVWENVAGAFSSNGGKDFQAVLSEIVRIAEPEAPDVPMPKKDKWPHSGELHDEMGRWSVAWRTHDAQYWGVPQRRKRISILFDGGGTTAAKILFEQYTGNESRPEIQPQPDSLPRDIEQSGTERKDPSATTREGANNTGECGGALSFQERAGKPGGGKGILIQNERTGALSTLNNQAVLDTDDGLSVCHGFPIGFRAENTRTYEEKSTTLCNGTRPGYTAGVITEQHAVFENHCQDSRYKALGDTCSTLATNLGTGGNNQPLVVKQPVCIGNGQADQTKESELVGALNCMHDQQAVITYSIGNGQVHDAMTPSKEVSKTLNCLEDPAKILAYGRDRSAYNQGQNAQYNFDIREEQAQTLVSKGPGAVKEPYSCVRRLTPLECERLQGFPDNWTDIGEWTDSKGKKHKEADAPRYKALGNSIAIPFWFWLLRRISAEYTRRATLGSLFDGIGGFPLCWEAVNGKGTARWASEIEEFPIAVTKKRFPEE